MNENQNLTEKNICKSIFKNIICFGKFHYFEILSNTTIIHSQNNLLPKAERATPKPTIGGRGFAISRRKLSLSSFPKMAFTFLEFYSSSKIKLRTEDSFTRPPKFKIKLFAALFQ